MQFGLCVCVCASIHTCPFIRAGMADEHIGFYLPLISHGWGS